MRWVVYTDIDSVRTSHAFGRFNAGVARGAEQKANDNDDDSDSSDDESGDEGECEGDDDSDSSDDESSSEGDSDDTSVSDDDKINEEGNGDNGVDGAAAAANTPAALAERHIQMLNILPHNPLAGIQYPPKHRMWTFGGSHNKK